MTRIILLATLLSVVGNAQTPFNKPLAKDQRIVHALHRLTFGPRPGDIEEVRRIGIEKWIAQQLQPASIAQNPALESRLKPLESLQMDTAAIHKEFPQANPLFARPPLLTEFLPPEQVGRVLNGGPKERLAILDTLEPAKRTKVLGMIPPANLNNQPELQKEAEAARAEVQAERQKEFRRLMPPLNDLLNPEQMQTAMRGSPEQVRNLMEYLDPTTRRQVAMSLPPQAVAALPDLRRQATRARQPQQVVLGDMKEGKIYRALYSHRQLEEVLVDFWSNHFNVFEGKAFVRPLLPSYERDAIRPHVLGKFRDLLLATARHPAMLYYLDNWQSVSPDAFSIGPFAEPIENMARQFARRTRGLNENYGRELMELHTMGVKGGYTQDDVIAVARCFTGWTIREPGAKTEFVFAAFIHDTGEKVVLGHKIPAGGGEQDGLQVIDILARHPSTARFISRKLAQRFVADDPPSSLVDRMAQTFTKSDGDLRAVLQTMFASPEFFSEGAWQSKIKSPFEIVVSAVRAIGAEADDVFTLAQKITDLGEPLYGKQEPTGYPETGEAWLSSSSLFGRINFGASLTSGMLPGLKFDTSRWTTGDVAGIARDILSSDPSPQTKDALQKGFEGKEPTSRVIAGLVIGSPDFQKR
jgi:uncharacterized protein (DUF1800 family)